MKWLMAVLMPWLLFSRQGKWLMAVLISWLLCS
jgi:hypothetical protein